MKRILLRAYKSPFQVASPAEHVHRDLMGTNVGNLMFSDAAHKLLTTPGQTVTATGRRTEHPEKLAAEVNEQYDVFVVPLANAFRPSFRAGLDRLTALVERLRIPVVVLGVGAQTNTDYATSRLDPMADSVRAFARAVLARSARIGVRGELTETYLRSLGFSDVEVIGCPSMFLHGGTFPAPRDPGAFGPTTRLAVNFSRGSFAVGQIKAIVARAVERYPDLLYYAQNHVDAERLLWGDVSPEQGQETAFPELFSHPLFRAGKVRSPLEPRTWMAELAERDFSFGTRIHGNITALLAGTPVVVLTHDSRTLELCRYFDIPHRLAKQAPADTDPEQLYGKADYGPMLAGHGERFRRMTAFLAAHDLENTFDHGDGGAAFEARWRALPPVPSLRPWDGSDDGAMRYRIALLRERLARTTAANARVEERVARLEARGVDGLPTRVRALAGPVRRQAHRLKRLAGRTGRA